MLHFNQTALLVAQLYICACESSYPGLLILKLK